jgi:hypothetical protein
LNDSTDGSALELDAAAPSAATGDAGGPWVEVGIPSGPDGLDFAPLDGDASLPLQTFGQGGTHVFLGVRTRGFGVRAFVTLRLTNLDTGAHIESPAPPRPQLFFCDDADWVCDLVPITVMTGGLTDESEERDGLPVQVEAFVENTAGRSGHAEANARLSTEDL